MWQCSIYDAIGVIGYLNMGILASQYVLFCYTIESPVCSDISRHVWMSEVWIIESYLIATDRIFTGHLWTVPDNHRAQCLDSNRRRGSYRWRRCACLMSLLYYMMKLEASNQCVVYVNRNDIILYIIIPLMKPYTVSCTSYWHDIINYVDTNGKLM